MSLIDEALKRAEADRRRLAGEGPGGQAGSGGGRPRRRGNLRGAVLLAVFAAAGVAAALRVSWAPRSSAPRPAAAEAGKRPAALQGEPAPAGPAGGDAALERRLSELANYRPSPQPPGEPAAVPRPTGPQPPTLGPPAVTPAQAPPAGEDGPALTPANFTLGGIMRSAHMANAVVNGQAVGVGDVIDGARVVEITARQVVLEKAGQRLTLRM